MSKIKMITLNSGYDCDERCYGNGRYQEIYTNSEKNRYVSWGTLDQQPNYLLELFLKSPLHHAIVEKKSQMIGGNGFEKNDSIDEFVKNVWGTESLDKLLSQISFDIAMLNGFWVNVIWNETRDYIASINYIKPINVRIGECKPGEKPFYIYSNDLNNPKELQIKYQAFEDISQLPLEERMKYPASTIDFLNILPLGNYQYPIPSYIAAEESIHNDAEIQTLHLTSIKNGFHPGHKITFFGDIPSEEEQEDLSNQMNRKFKGGNNSAKTFLFFAENKDLAPTIEPIASIDDDKRYIEIDKNIMNKIMFAHQITDPELVGIKVAGELGSNKDITVQLAIFQSQYITPLQNKIEEFFQKFLTINGITEKIRVNKYTLKIPIKIVPTDILSILASPVQDFQKRVIFEMIGYDPVSIEKLLPKNTLNNNDTTA